MNRDNIFLKALDSAVAAVTGSPPQNMARPPGATQAAIQPPAENVGNLAAAVNSGAFGPPSRNSPMDHTTVIPRQHDALEGIPFPSAENMRRISVALEDFDLANQVASPAEIEAILDCERRWNNLSETAQRFTHSAARRDHREHIDTLTRRISEGDKSVGDGDAWDRSEFESDYAIKLTATKLEMKKIEREASLIAGPIRIRISNAVGELASILEAPGRHSAENFAMAYVPSNVILMLRRAAAVAADPLASWGGRPLEQVSFLPIANKN